MIKIWIHFPVEGLSDLPVKRNKIVGIVAVQLSGKIQEFTFALPILYRYDVHHQDD